METRSVRRKRLIADRHEYLGRNHFDDLPDDIIHDILSLLPVKSAAQTVILSQRWKKLFPCTSDLDFTTPLFTNVSDFNNLLSTDSQTDQKFLNNVLSHRDKNFPIRKLKVESNYSFTTLKRLFRNARINQVHELDVRANLNLTYINFPCKVLMDCLSLKILRLACMSFVFKPTQSSLLNLPFKSLHTVSLSKISFRNTQSLDIFNDSTFPDLKKFMLDNCYNLQEVTMKCSKLEDLVMKECNLKRMDIYGPKLEKLKVNSCFIDRNMKGKIKIIAPVLKYMKWVNNNIIHIPIMETSSLLEKAVIGLVYYNFNSHLYRHMGPEIRQGWSNMLAVLSDVKSLKFHHPTIEIFSRNDIENIVKNKFEKLRELKICTKVNKYFYCNNFKGFVTLFKNSPYLHTLVISLDFSTYLKKNEACERQRYFDPNKYWINQLQKITSFLNHLRTVKFVGFEENDKYACSLANFLLEYAEDLENMTLHTKQYCSCRGL